MHHRISKLEREIEEIKFEEDDIKKSLDNIHKNMDKTPDHFSKKDILRAFLGSLFLAFNVSFSGNIVNISRNLPTFNIFLVIVFTIVILTSEIYFIGYNRVENKRERGFIQFWIKRILAFYIVAVLVAFMITYVFGLIYIVDDFTHYMNLIFIISGPASIGASISDLLKKY
jgi:uncharacterized membrane protein